uniref:C2 domain-containing protein n=1 Tax=Myripristis murdjan TaxID=586833 RepID=A0A667X6L1_9TELE
PQLHQHLCLASLNRISVGEVQECVKTGLSLGLGKQSPSDLSSRCRVILSNQDTVTGYSQGPTVAYVVIWHGEGYRKTDLIESNSPCWNAYFVFDDVDTSDQLRLLVWDEDVLKSYDFLGCLKYGLSLTVQ